MMSRSFLAAVRSGKNILNLAVAQAPDPAQILGGVHASVIHLSDGVIAPILGQFVHLPHVVPTTTDPLGKRKNDLHSLAGKVFFQGRGHNLHVIGQVINSRPILFR